MRVAPEGWPFIAAALLVCLALVLVRFWVPLAVWLPLTVWVVAFFRDPARPGPRGEQLVIAPADGKVVSVIPIEEPDFLKGPSTRISIFMNVFNVHVNRYPADGTIAWQAYTPGAFLNAATEKASRENEQSSIGLATARGPILVRQIAGLVARRIVTDGSTGQAVRQGDRMGLIRFGSRVDVFVPPGVRTRVTVGQTTRAGQTIIAEWP
jgi:phosphatidylserine decarboxylase